MQNSEVIIMIKTHHSLCMVQTLSLFRNAGSSYSNSRLCSIILHSHALSAGRCLFPQRLSGGYFSIHNRFLPGSRELREE